MCSGIACRRSQKPLAPRGSHGRSAISRRIRSAAHQEMRPAQNRARFSVMLLGISVIIAWLPMPINLVALRRLLTTGKRAEHIAMEDFPHRSVLYPAAKASSGLRHLCANAHLVNSIPRKPLVRTVRKARSVICRAPRSVQIAPLASSTMSYMPLSARPVRMESSAIGRV